MSNRKTILDALRGGPATREELADACPTLTVGRKLVDTISDCKKVGLIRLEKDITGLPAYRLTMAGKSWLKNPAASAKPQPGVGKKRPAVSEPETLVEGGKHDADSAPVADTVVEPLPQDEAPAAAGSDEIPAPDYHPDEVCFDAVKRADALRERAERAEIKVSELRFALAMIEAAIKPDPDEGIVPAIKRLQDRAERTNDEIESILSANRKFCAWVSELVGGEEYPINLYECQQIIDRLQEGCIEERTRLEELALQASRQREAWREVAEQYGHETPLDLAGYIGELLNRIATLEGNASLPLENTPETASTAENQPADMVNQPPHYQGKVECIDAIESALGPDGFAAYCRGNALKYTYRAGRKGDARQDIAKAAWYLGRLA